MTLFSHNAMENPKTNENQLFFQLYVTIPRMKSSHLTKGRRNKCFIPRFIGFSTASFHLDANMRELHKINHITNG